MKLPLLLEEIRTADLPVVIDDAVEHFGVTPKMEWVLAKSGSYYEVMGYMTECYLSSTTPDLDKQDIDILGNIVKVGCLGRAYTAA